MPSRAGQHDAGEGHDLGPGVRRDDGETDRSEALGVVDVVADVGGLGECDATSLELGCRTGSLSSMPPTQSMRIFRARAETASFVSEVRMK